jgi:hypothetical protein
MRLYKATLALVRSRERTVGVHATTQAGPDLASSRGLRLYPEAIPMSAEATLPTSRVESIHRCAQHLRVWLAATGLTYDTAAREGFVRAHPDLFGRAHEVTLRGYDQWRRQHAITDTLDGFARYIARRHQRWMGTNGHTPALAPCLVGTATERPCWYS